jgi:hypothetical protein
MYRKPPSEFWHARTYRIASSIVDFGTLMPAFLALRSAMT